MGAHGPIPKRSDERRRVNRPDGPDLLSAPGAPLVIAPEGDPSWHPMASGWYASLAESGQARFYEPSDWQTARVWAEILSRQLSAARLSAQMIAAWGQVATELLTTEGSRRRARLELERVGEVDEDEARALASVTEIAGADRSA